MVIVDSTASPAPLNPAEKRLTSKQRHRVRNRSGRLVRKGLIDLAPCLVCGTLENLSIHHVEPFKVDRFVFLCESCHALAHRPVYQTIEVCVASGHFSVRPEAILPRKEVACG